MSAVELQIFTVFLHVAGFKLDKIAWKLMDDCLSELLLVEYTIAFLLALLDCGLVLAYFVRELQLRGLLQSLVKHVQFIVVALVLVRVENKFLATVDVVRGAFVPYSFFLL